jgi:hypothetical protein
MAKSIGLLSNSSDKSDRYKAGSEHIKKQIEAAIKNYHPNMIAGIGTDIIEWTAVAAKIEKETGFRELVFSQNEIQYCESKAHKYEHYAARLAVKKHLPKRWAPAGLREQILMRQKF